MLFVGDQSTIISHDNVKVFNISSYIEGYERLKLLPTYQISCSSEQEFDIQYAQYILNNDTVFYEFMKIIMALYTGMHVYLIMSKSDDVNMVRYDAVNESLLKLIQQRYGYPYHMINDISDLEIINIYDTSSFRVSGLYNLDIDKERFIFMNVAKAVEVYGDNKPLPEGHVYFQNV